MRGLERGLIDLGRVDGCKSYLNSSAWPAPPGLDSSAVTRSNLEPRRAAKTPAPYALCRAGVDMSDYSQVREINRARAPLPRVGSSYESARARTTPTR